MIPVNHRVTPYFERHLLPLAGQPSLRFCQIGVYMGDTTLWLMDNVLTAASSRLDDVDPWTEYADFAPGLVSQAEAEYHDRLASRGWGPAQGLFTHKMKSSDFFSVRTSVGAFDFVYIDGDHRAPAVMSDAVMAWDRLHPGGILAFDDYVWPEAPGMTVRSPELAIDAFLSIYQDELVVLDSGIQVWVQKTRP